MGRTEYTVRVLIHCIQALFDTDLGGLVSAVVAGGDRCAGSERNRNGVFCGHGEGCGRLLVRVGGHSHSRIQSGAAGFRLLMVGIWVKMLVRCSQCARY